MFDAKQVKHRCVEIVNFVTIFYCAISEVICPTDIYTAFHTAASHPHGEAEWIVITTVGALCKWRAPEFTAPNHQRRIEEPRSF